MASKAPVAPVTPQTIFGANLAFWHDSTRGIVFGSGSEVATWEDQSGNAIHYSQATGALRPVSSGTGVDADGTSQYMTAADAAVLDPTTAFTVAIDVTPDVATGNRCPLTKSTTLGTSWSFQSNATGLRFHIGSPGISFGEVSLVLAAGVRVSVVVVYDGTQATNATRLVVYVNGVAATVAFTGTIPATIPVGTNPLTVFAYAGPAQYWDGKARMTVGANVAASPAQVAAIYAFGAALP